MGTKKVVINKCYGGFSLSDEALDLYKQLTGTRPKFDGRDLDRDDPVLALVVEQLDAAADGDMADLGIVTIPDDVEWYVEEYDGREWVAEVHRTWR